MAVKINNTTVIDDTRKVLNIPSITFADGTVQTTGKTLTYGMTKHAAGSLKKVLDNPNAFNADSAYDEFGYAVTIQGSTALIGARAENDAGGVDAGKVYVYDMLTRKVIKTLDDPNQYGSSGSDSFGISLSLNDNYAIIGAYGENDVSGYGSGVVHIYNSTTWSRISTITNPNPYSTGTNDYFGRSVAISGNYAIVGAWAEDDAGGTNSGKAYIYNVTTGALVWTLDNPNAYDTSASDAFGFSVAIYSNYAIGGA